MATPSIADWRRPPDHVSGDAAGLRLTGGDDHDRPRGAVERYGLQHVTGPPTPLAEPVEYDACGASGWSRPRAHSGTRLVRPVVSNRTRGMANSASRHRAPPLDGRLLAAAARHVANRAADPGGPPLTAADGRGRVGRDCRVAASPRRSLPAWVAGISSDSAHPTADRASLCLLSNGRPTRGSGQNGARRDALRARGSDSADDRAARAG